MDTENNKSWTCLSSFILKIIAIVTMTIDHVGAMLLENIGSQYTLGLIFRYIGRLSLPLFCFMIVEGVLHTKKLGNYLLRLGIMATIVSVGLVSLTYIPFFKQSGISVWGQGNIYIDLLLGAIAVFLLRRKEWYFKLLSLVPLFLGIASYIATCIEFSEDILIHWFPFFLRPQYHFYSIGMIMLFYIVYIFKDLFLKYYSNNSGIPVETLEGTQIERKTLNIMSFGVVIVSTIMFFVVSLIIPSDWVYYQPGVQNFAMVAGAFVLLYSGKRGYNAKWFQITSYAYYPVHLIIIYGLGMFI